MRQTGLGPGRMHRAADKSHAFALSTVPRRRPAPSDATAVSKQLATLCVALALWPMAATAQTATPQAIDAELKIALEAKPDVAQGKVAYEVCEGCHRKDGSGRANGTYPRLSGQHSRVVVKQLVDIRTGRRHNPDMAPLVAETLLSLQAMADIAAYVQGLPVAANNGKGPGNDPALGQQLYARDCSTCHGTAGQGDATAFYPMVAAQHYRYLLRELVNIGNGLRRNSHADMVKVVKPYSQAELDAVADHMSRLPPPAR
jgi:cytochrome c553